MKVYRTTSTDPYFNLASEEYLIDHFDGEDIFMLWRNEPAVIIGTNQNAYTELDIDFASSHGIKIVRRLTGGGAVFHDLGNVNFSFITKHDGVGSLNFEKFCRPVADAISLLGVPCEVSGRNDILADGRKISGNAQCVRNGCVLHHGTLLWSADFSEMAGVLKPDPSKLQSKGIKSVRSRVANLRDLMPDNPYLSKSADAREFMGFLESRFPGEIREFSAETIEGIRRLAEEKYSRWEWNMGKSGSFSSALSKRFPFGRIELEYNADRGIITEISVKGDFFGEKKTDELEERLKSGNVRPEYESVLEACGDISAFISGAAPEDFAGLFVSENMKPVD